MLDDALLLCGLAVTAELLSYLAAAVGDRIDRLHSVFRRGDRRPELAERP